MAYRVYVLNVLVGESFNLELRGDESDNNLQNNYEQAYRSDGNVLAWIVSLGIENKPWAYISCNTTGVTPGLYVLTYRAKLITNNAVVTSDIYELRITVFEGYKLTLSTEPESLYKLNIKTLPFYPPGTITNLSGVYFSKNFITAKITGLAPGQRVRVFIEMRQSYQLGSWVNITPAYIYGDANASGETEIELQNYIDAFLETQKFEDDFPSINTTPIYVRKRYSNFRYYYQVYNNANINNKWQPSNPSASSVASVILGQLTFLEFKTNFIQALADGKKFLSTRGNNRRYKEGFQEVLTWLNYSLSAYYFVVIGVKFDNTKTTLLSYQSDPNDLDMVDYSFKFTNLSEYRSLLVSLSPTADGSGIQNSQILSYDIIKNTDNPIRCFRYKNRLGGWESLFTSGEQKKQTNTEKEEFEIYTTKDYTIRKGQQIVRVESKSTSFKQSTGWLSSEQLCELEDFVSSDEIYEIVNEPFANTPVPIKILTKKIENKKDRPTQSDCKLDFEATYLFEGLR